jgi:hypothetical protein
LDSEIYNLKIVKSNPAKSLENILKENNAIT